MAGEGADEAIQDVSLGGPTMSAEQFGDACSNLNTEREHLDPPGVSLQVQTGWQAK